MVRAGSYGCSALDQDEKTADQEAGKVGHNIRGNCAKLLAIVVLRE